MASRTAGTVYRIFRTVKTKRGSRVEWLDDGGEFTKSEKRGEVFNRRPGRQDMEKGEKTATYRLHRLTSKRKNAKRNG